ncbi:ERMES complex subunit mmm1 [Loxospora ochrophaea]|nr:ERMES complex subunit mmm1 [Loxospora ochrophaea]
MSQDAATQPPQSSLSFTQGFLLGQLSIVILIGAFIKFFIFGEPPSPETTAAARALSRQKQTSLTSHSHKRSNSLSLASSTAPPKLHTKPSSSILRSPPSLTPATILSKTYYNVHSHQPESLDWFNVLIAQTIAQFRTDASHDDAILSSLTSVLNGPYKPDFLAPINVTEINLGEDFPIFSNCRVHPVPNTDPNTPDGLHSGGGRLQARMDVDLSDALTLGIDTKMILNYPRPLTAVLPVALAVSVVRFSGTLSISFLPSQPPSAPTDLHRSSPPTTLAFSFLPDYRLDLSIRTLLGSRSRLQDVPKIAQLIENRLHTWFDERCVEPRMQQVVLPSLWPRKKNTRGPEGEAEGEEEASTVGGGAAKEKDENLRFRRNVATAPAASESESERATDPPLRMPGSMPGLMLA